MSATVMVDRDIAVPMRDGVTLATSWPPPRALVRYYFRGGRLANTRFGDGSLALDAPGYEPEDSDIA